MRPVAVFRFSPTEGPAYFADWMNARGVPWQLVALDAGDAVPADPKAFAGIGMMGGPMSVNDGLSWNAPLQALLREAVAHDVPIIGHCLGGQLLAQALGAPVRRADVTEIGWHDVDVTVPHAASDWFGGRARFPAFQWHYDAFALPDGATRVLTNEFNPNQAYVVGDRHIGFQCHVEMTRELVDTWCKSGADELPTVSNAAQQSETDIRRDVGSRIAGLNAVAADIYTRWAQKLRH
jgi:GMP synthase-like glutamine amidotransferase